METKTFYFGNDRGGYSGNGFDPNLLFGMMMGGGGFGGFGGGNWLLPWLLFALWGNNGFGGFGGNNGTNFLSSQLNDNAGRELIMQAIQGNANAIQQLSTTLGCSIGDLQQAINAMSTQLCNVGNQVGMSSMQIINAINSGDNALARQLADCCCATQKEILRVDNTITRGISDLGYATQQQTCAIEKAIASSTESILAGQRAAEMREMQREITERDRKIAEQANAINNYQQTQTFGAMITAATQPIASAVNNLQSDVDGIKCRLPKTEVIPATPEYIPINRSINIPYCNGLYGNGFGWNGWNNGSLWG